MKKITKWFLSFILCLSFCFPAMAYPPDYEYAYELPTLPSIIEENGYDYLILYSPSMNGEPYYKLYIFDTARFSGRISSTGDYYDMSIIKDDGCYGVLCDSYKSFKGKWSSLSSYGSSGFWSTDIAYSTVDVIIDGVVVFPANASGSGGSNKQEYVYDSSIPAPQNLQFAYKKEGGLPIVHIGGTVFHTLTWSNALVDSYGVRISAKIEALDTESNSKMFDLMVCSDGSDGADAGYPASSGSFRYDFGKLDKRIEEASGFGNHLSAWRVVQYRVQFYEYVDGVMNVGPVGVIHMKKNMGVYSGTAVTVEKPIDSDNLGNSGGLHSSDSVDGWNSKGEDFTEYDPSGNITGSGVVDDDSSYVNGGSNNTITSLKDLIKAFVNIPTVIAQFFNSLSEMMSGIGTLPSVLAGMFGFLPAPVISLIGLGLMLVVVLRIVGR